MKLTSDQLRAVTATGTDLSVLAGAGSGKTRVLIDRSVHLVTECDLPLSSLLAITFTEKAAREMKERLAAALEEARGVEARAEVEWAYVSTIHGFCARLLRENAIEAGLDPAFEVLDEVQSGTLLQRAFARAGEALTRDRPDAAEALSRLAVSDLEASILGLYRESRGAGMAPDELSDAEPDPARFTAAMDRVIELVDAVFPLAETATAKSAEKASRVLDLSLAIRQAAAEPPAEAISVLTALVSSIKLNVSKDLKAVFRPLRDEAAPAAIRAATDFRAWPVVMALRDLLIGLDAAYDAAKEEAATLDFADLELRALRLLREHPPVRAAVRRRFHQILVDEYQDVNPVQEAIIAEIRTDDHHFAVGDVKQAIYGFRHADPRLFAGYSNAVGEAGRVVLKENFRSDPALVEFANHCFSRLFADDELIAWTDMVAARPEPETEGPAIEIMVSEFERAPEARAAEAVAIARRIRRLVRGGDAAFGDVAILFRALTDVKIYERALEDHDVPFYIVKGGGFYQAREIVDLTCLLKTVRNPRDSIALAATLRSPFAALREDGLLALALDAKRKAVDLADLLADPGRVAGLTAADEERWLRFAAMLDRLRTLAGRGTIREVAEAALDESGYGTAVWLLRGGHRRAANFEKALELADSFEGRFSLAEFLDALTDFRAREIRETEAPTGGEQEDVVRLLTVHGAKGLEFPVVFVPDLSRASAARAPDLLLEGDRIGVRIRDDRTDDRYDTTLFAESKDARARREEEESLRVLYVAVTRAERRLILSGRDGKRTDGTWWAALRSVLDLSGERAGFGENGRFAGMQRITAGAPTGQRRVSLAGRSLARLAGGEPLERGGEESLATADRLIEHVGRPRPATDLTPYQSTISELLTYSACPFCHYLRYNLGVIPDLSVPEPEERTGHDELPPTDFGIAVHEVLKAWDPQSGIPVLEAARVRLGSLLPVLTDDLVEQVAGMVTAFYASGIGCEVSGADPLRVRREVPFLTRWRTGEGLPDLLFRGQIDLLYPRPDGTLSIVDYKTGRSPPERYEVQMVSYARAVRGFGGEAVTAALVYLARDGGIEVHEVPLTDGSMRQAEEMARKFARYLLDGTRPDRHEPDCPITS